MMCTRSEFSSSNDTQLQINHLSVYTCMKKCLFFILVIPLTERPWSFSMRQPWLVIEG